MAGAGGQRSLGAMDAQICAALEELRRIEGIAAGPDGATADLQNSITNLVARLNDVHRAASSRDGPRIPTALLTEYIDKGLSPSEYSAALADGAHSACRATRGKMKAIRELGGELRRLAGEEGFVLPPPGETPRDATERT